MLTAVIAVHIAAGLAAVITAATAMLAAKRPGRHPRAGRLYLTALALLATTATLITLARPHTAYLLIPGGIALAAAAVGLTARRVRWRGWLGHHITGMAVSVIAMLTAFYVDNGPRLPLWQLLPPITFWFLPAAIGLPLLAHALRRRDPPTQRPTERVR